LSQDITSASKCGRDGATILISAQVRSGVTYLMHYWKVSDALLLAHTAVILVLIVTVGVASLSSIDSEILHYY
jgi:hypothetical protein